VKGEWKSGLTAGIPIFLGYLSVSFGIGILASNSGLSVAEAVFMSVANLTSAGQVASIEIIAAGGSVLEIIATQFVINLRYALMALSLSQKADDSLTTPKRLALSYGITDEIFALCVSRDKDVTAGYMGGILVISTIGWTLGTFLGAAAGRILPSSLTDAMGIMLYGMFIAIFLPAAKRDRHVCVVVAAASLLSCLFYYVIRSVSGGFSVIICALAASFLGALLFPVAEDDPDDERDSVGGSAPGDERDSVDGSAPGEWSSPDGEQDGKKEAP
jgi:predicted branched-subunit amino acid permease